MEDILLVDAAERFVRGEMSAEEKLYFEDLRSKNPELDQAVVEQLFFFNQLENFGKRKNFKAILNEVEGKLVEEKFITRTAPAQEGKLITLWHRYKKDIAVAASIAGIVSIFIASAVSTFSANDKSNIEPLVKQLNDQARKTKKIETQLNQMQAGGNANVQGKTMIDARFRATGFIIDATNNYIVTNAHVVKKASHNLIVENNKGLQFDAKAVYVNEAQDLAIIKITDSSFKSVGVLPYNIRKGGAELGESIFLMGFPKQEIVYNEGYVSAKNGYQLDTVFCQINTTANEGNSGSPVVTKNGDLIGIITSKETDANGVVFAIKSVNIHRAVAEIRKQNADEKIKITNGSTLKGLDRVSQIKKMEGYVFMIKGN
jgi:serine protease Do